MAINDDLDLDMDMDSDIDQPRQTAGTRGFGAMDPEKQREIASKGGKASHKKGTAHEWDSREAAEAGRRGGQR